jgi:hypothetical protein
MDLASFILSASFYALMTIIRPLLWGSVSKTIIQRPVKLSSGSSSFLLQDGFTASKPSRRRFCPPYSLFASSGAGPSLSLSLSLSLDIHIQRVEREESLTQYFLPLDLGARHYLAGNLGNHQMTCFTKNWWDFNQAPD